MIIAHKAPPPSFTNFTHAPPNKCGGYVKVYILFLADSSYPKRSVVAGPGWQKANERSASAKSQISRPWLEAWNVFISIRVQAALRMALAMVKHQTTICQLFSPYGPVAALKYDKLFRQAAARTKDHTLHWDRLKEDLLVWCVTTCPFGPGSRPTPSLVKVPSFLSSCPCQQLLSQ